MMSLGANMSDQASGRGGSGGRQRRRGTVPFPYADLEEGISVARATWSSGGVASIDQIAPKLGHDTVKSGAFRSKLSAAKLFGFVAISGSDVTLTGLGQRVLAPDTEEAARAEAFLRVIPFKSLFDRHRGTLLPGPAVLERQLDEIGVAPKQVERARQVFQRSAEQAGFFRAGRDRLVPPSTSQAGTAPSPAPPPESAGAKERKSLRDHPLIQGLFEMLPENGAWPDEERAEWFKAAAANFRLVYGSGKEQGSSESGSASETPPPDGQSRSVAQDSAS